MPGDAFPISASPADGLRPRTVDPRPLAELAALPDVDALIEPVDAGPTVVTGVTHASDAIRPGDLFAALPGARRHGAEFAASAAAAGAVAVLTDRAGAALVVRAGLPALVVEQPRAALGPVASAVYGEPSRDVCVIGITGTAGKTSTAYLVEAGLRAAGRTPGLIGTVQTRLGDLVVDSVRTTPEATDLHALLALARERGVDSVVMEVSSHALAMGRVGGVHFAAGGFTNFGLDHLDFHTDAADYFAAKARLFDGRCRVEVINLDDPALRPLLRPATVSYSATGDPAATWRAVDRRLRLRAEESGAQLPGGAEGAGRAGGADPGRAGCADPGRPGAGEVLAAGGDEKHAPGFAQCFTALGPDGIAVPAGVGLPGTHNVANALLAIALLAAVGVDPATAAAGVAACPGVPGRMERVAAPGPVAGVVDYAHKPDAIVAVLAALRGMLTDPTGPPGGRLICVLGAGGDRDRGKRHPMGLAAAQGADLVIVTDDNPRTEAPADIRAQVLAGAADAVGGAEVREVPGRAAAIDAAVASAAPGDVIALLGKGHERGQEINDTVHPFDDRVELAAALAARFADSYTSCYSSGPAAEGRR